MGAPSRVGGAPPLPEPFASAVAAYAVELRRHFGGRVHKIAVFGSWARGEAHQHSDFDVAVVLSELDWASRAAAIDLATDVGLETDLLISATVFDREVFDEMLRHRRRIALDIEREGLEL